MVLSESAAILIYLAKKAGQLIPADPAGEAQVVRWCFAAMNTVELPLLTLLLLGFVTKQDEPPAYRDFALGWAKRHLANLERWLEGREFIATEAFTVADIPDGARARRDQGPEPAPTLWPRGQVSRAVLRPPGLEADARELLRAGRGGLSRRRRTA